MRKEGDLKAWWIPQVPMKAFPVDRAVRRVESAKRMAAKLKNMSECRERVTTGSLATVAEFLDEFAVEYEKLISALEARR